MTDPQHAASSGFLTDASIGAFLAARRKAIAGLLAFAGILVAGGIVPPSVALWVQGIIAVLGLYGIHEVANDSAVKVPGAEVAPPMGEVS